MTEIVAGVRTCVIVLPGVSDDFIAALQITGLVDRLAEVINEGYEVSLVYTHRAFVSELLYTVAGSQIPVLPLLKAQPGHSLGPMSPCMFDCRCVYEQLRAMQPIDRIIGSNRSGLLFYVQNARRQGLAFDTAEIEIVVAEPSLHIRQSEGLFCDGYGTAVNDWLERHSVEMAGHLTIQTRYMRDWMVRAGYRIPADSPVARAQNFSEAGVKSGTLAAPPHEFVFVGGLTRRNGLSHFIKALNKLTEYRTDFKVSFIGADPRETSLRLEFDSFLAQTPLACKILRHASVDAVLDYLNDIKRMAVILPVEDVAPWVVDLMISSGKPVMIPAHHSLRSVEQTRMHNIFILDCVKPTSLADSMRGILDASAAASREVNRNHNRSVDVREVNSMETVKRQITIENHSVVQPVPVTKISVCVAHYCRPQLLGDALDSLAKQTLPGFEVIVVDDGSPAQYQPALKSIIEQYQEKLNLRLIVKNNAYLGASRNTAWREAAGDYILFMDDDNLAVPNEIEVFATAAANSGDDVLTCFSDTFDDCPDGTAHPTAKNRITPIGPCLSVGSVFNCFGDSNSFWRKVVLEKLDGFTELQGVGKEDNEIFARAVFAGFKLSVVPERLFYYRLSNNRMRHHHLNPESGTHHVIGTYRSRFVPELREMADLVVGQERKIQMLEARLNATTAVLERTGKRASMLNALLEDKNM